MEPYYNLNNLSTKKLYDMLNQKFLPVPAILYPKT